MKKATHRKVFEELLKKPRVLPEIKEQHGDIEDEVEAAGGKRGALRHA